MIKKHLYLSLVLIFILNNYIFGQTEKARLIILPFISKGVDSTLVTNSEAILRNEIEKLIPQKLISEKQTYDAVKGKYYEDTDVISEIGKQLISAEALLIKMIALGQKTIIQYRLIDIEKKQNIIVDNITSSTVEDLDMVMKRIATSVVNHESAKSSAEIGNITESETKGVLSRQSRKYWGLNFGYNYPIDGFSPNDKSFTMDIKIGSETPDYDYGMQIFARDGFGVNIFSSILYSKKDFCPFIGAGAGFHWIWHSGGRKTGDGFEAVVNSGLRLFHTYGFRLTLNLSFSYSFNSYNSKAVIFTIGFIN